MKHDAILAGRFRSVLLVDCIRSSLDTVHKGTHFKNILDRTRLIYDALLFLLAQSIKSVPGRLISVKLSQKVFGSVWDILHHNHLKDSLSQDEANKPRSNAKTQGTNCSLRVRTGVLTKQKRRPSGGVSAWWRVADSPACGRAGSRLWRATGTPFTPAPFESARESLPNRNAAHRAAILFGGEWRTRTVDLPRVRRTL